MSRTLACLSFLAIMTDAAVNMCVPVFMWAHVFVFLSYTSLGAEVLGCVITVSDFLRFYQSVSQNDSTILGSYQWCMVYGCLNFSTSSGAHASGFCYSSPIGWQSSREKETERERSSVCWFTSRVAQIARAGPIKSEEIYPGPPCGCTDPWTCAILYRWFPAL